MTEHKKKSFNFKELITDKFVRHLIFIAPTAMVLLWVASFGFRGLFDIMIIGSLYFLVAKMFIRNHTFTAEEFSKRKLIKCMLSKEAKVITLNVAAVLIALTGHFLFFYFREDYEGKIISEYLNYNVILHVLTSYTKPILILAILNCFWFILIMPSHLRIVNGEKNDNLVFEFFLIDLFRGNLNAHLADTFGTVKYLKSGLKDSLPIIQQAGFKSVTIKTHLLQPSFSELLSKMLHKQECVNDSKYTFLGEQKNQGSKILFFKMVVIKRKKYAEFLEKRNDQDYSNMFEIHATLKPTK